jgi:2-polyprenyl-3-methyl-5-hydroxy-6-metoxy-1,4-benzoquinol methylase
MERDSKLTHCLCCAAEVASLIDFGAMPLANTYNVTERFPLRVNLCPSCQHLQLNESVDPNILFREYSYFSGTSRTALDFFAWFAGHAKAMVSGADKVLDIACNDGSQLDAFRELGLTTAGIDAAENIATIAAQKGHLIHCGLFESMNLRKVPAFDIITAQNVLAHTAQPERFLRRCGEMMAPNARLFVTCSQADMIHEGDFDSIYHEHISYFNANSMQKLCRRAGLILLDIRMHPIHGTSYIFIIGKDGTPSESVSDRLALESSRGLYDSFTYERWVALVAEKIRKKKREIERAKADGYLTVGCGAAAKGISFLNAAGVKLDLLVDTTPAKHGKMASGMMIHPFEHLASLDGAKVALVILAWNFEKELRENIRRFRDKPGDIFLTTK